MKVRSQVRLVASGSLLAFLGTGCVKSSSESEVSASPAWRAENQWDDAAEEQFSTWVEKLGTARAAGVCTKLAQCLKKPEANTLFSKEDSALNVFADCADVPAVLRGYFAYKTKRPFSFVSSIHGTHYSAGNTPAGTRDFRNYSSVQSLLNAISDNVHSGFFRTAPDVEGTDTYPIDISRDSVKPGVVFYDPNGHVAVVYKVESNGMVRLIDGHPDNSLTFTAFGEKFVRGGASQGGGFRAWRRLRMESDKIVRAKNSESRFYSATAQYRGNYELAQGRVGSYYDWVRARLGNGKMNPLNEFNEKLDTLCVDMVERVDAVAGAVKAGLDRKPHPSALPENIFGADGDWEAYATPSRDARLKVSVVSLQKYINESVARAQAGDRSLEFKGTASDLVNGYFASWRSHVTSASCKAVYQNSAGGKVVLSLEDVVQRLWRLSFDPYDCPELRWGASSATSDFATCPRNAEKLAWYEKEQRLRNNLERVTNVPTPLDFGPAQAPQVDIGGLLTRLGASTVSVPPVPSPEVPRPEQAVLGQITCPSGYTLTPVGNAGGKICRNGRQVWGPFTRLMTNECQAQGLGDQCHSSIWDVDVALSLRGTGVCPRGAAQDAVTKYCVEGVDVFGPFPQAAVNECISHGGTESICRSSRWDYSFLLSLLKEIKML